MDFQHIVFKLKEYWAAQNCVIQEPYDGEVGAGTMAPETFLRVLGSDPYRVAYVQPSRRPADALAWPSPLRQSPRCDHRPVRRASLNGLLP